MKRNEKADRDPGGQDRGQGHLHRGFAVLPAAQVLDLNPHPTLLDLLSKTTAYRPPAIDRASNQGRRMRSLWLLKPTPISTFGSSYIALESVGPERVIERGLTDLQPGCGLAHGQSLADHVTSTRQLLGVDNRFPTALSASRRG